MWSYLAGFATMGVVWVAWATRATWNPWAKSEIDYLKSKLAAKSGQ